MFLGYLPKKNNSSKNGTMAPLKENEWQPERYILLKKYGHCTAQHNVFYEAVCR